MTRIATLCGLLAGLCAAQEFEVASVKPAGPRPPFAIASGLVRFRADEVRFEATSDSMLGLIAFAYGMKSDLISGPGWMGEQYYSIEAKPPAGATKEEVPAMLRKLLADRFQLKAHHDQKVEPVYEMVVDKKGSKLKPSTGTESDQDCMLRAGECFCRASTLAQLASYLSSLVNFWARMAARAPAGDLVERAIDHPVVDQTGLTGIYDIDLQWVPPAGLGPIDKVASEGYPARDPSAKSDSIFGALEAAGLKLQRGSHAFDSLVIDHVERVPSGN